MPAMHGSMGVTPAMHGEHGSHACHAWKHKSLSFGLHAPTHPLSLELPLARSPSLSDCSSSPLQPLQIKTSWREVPNNTGAVSRLSPEIKDLLDKMFEVKQVGGA